MSFISKIKKRGLIGTLIPLAGNRLAVGIFRISSKLHKYKIPELPYLFQYLNAIINGCEIHYKATIGKGFKISHSRGIVIGLDAVIGDNVTVHSSVVLGKNGSKPGMPAIGNNVFIGAGAVIVGKVNIGHNSVIGANSFVNKSFSDHVLIGGVPAKEIKKL